MSEDATPAQPPQELPQLNKTARRVLGVLVEKAFCTPEYYPLTANALITGCNQKNNRDPVTDLQAHVVDETLLQLQKIGLVTRVLPATGRTERFKHNIKEAWQLERPHRAVLAELMLRGPQAEGELRGRASRMVEIPSLDELRAILDALMARGFVRRISEEGRRRGVIWTQVLCRPEELAQIQQKFASEAEEPTPERATSPTSASTPASRAPAVDTVGPLVERIARLESELESTRTIVHDVRDQLTQLLAAHKSLESELRTLRNELGS